MKKVVLLLFLSLFLVSPVLAVDLSEPASKITEVVADAGEDRTVVVGRQVVFSAYRSQIPENAQDVKYSWNLGDGTSKVGEEAIHLYRQTGAYRVKLMVTAQVGEVLYEKTDEIIVSASKDVFVLISDEDVSEEEFTALQTYATSQGISLLQVTATKDDLEYVTEKELAIEIINRKEELKQATAVVIWTEKNTGLNAFLEAAQRLNEDQGELLSGYGEKHVVVITDQNFSATSKVAQSVYNLLSPSFVVLAREDNSQDVFTTSSVDVLLDRLRDNGADYRVVGLHTQRDFSTLKVWNFMSYLVGYMVDKGVPLNTIYLILILPVIATVIAFSRQVIGFRALGIYTPSIIAVLFLITGLKYGLAIFVLTLLVGTLGRLSARKVRLAYLPRMAMVITLVFLAVFVMFVLGSYFNKTGLLEMTIFPILVMVLLTEKFINVQIERGRKRAAILVLETLFLSVVCYFIANWLLLRTFVLGYPEVIFLTLIINYFVGKWTGLRLIEMYRFRKVIKNVEISEKK